MSERSEMALLQHQRLPGIGCSNILPRARAQCLAAASHAACLPVLLCVVAEASAAANVTPAQAPRSIGVSDVLWPSAGAFLAMAVLGRMDQMIAFKGVQLTIAPLGAVCSVLFTAPASPALL